jgi:hypothetical protein
VFDKVRLPTTPQGFNALVERVVAKYKFTDTNHASAIVSVAIQHLPPHQAYTTIKYLGDYVTKNLANYAARHVSSKLQHEAQVDQLVSMVKSDPKDTEARDKLQQAANEGSEYAKIELKKLDPDEPLKELVN